MPHASRCPGPVAFATAVLVAVSTALMAQAAGPARASSPALRPAASPAKCGFGEAVRRPERLELLDFHSAGLQRDICVAVLLPPEPLDPPRSYPVVVLLHGLDGEPSVWVRRAAIHEHLDRAVAAGILPPLIAVAPVGENGYWTNRADGRAPWGDMVVRELLGAVRAAYPAAAGPERTALVGFSMGGFGALSLALRHPEAVGAAVALSPTDILLAVADWPRRAVYRHVFGDPADPARLATLNPVDLVRAGAGQGQHFALVHGTREPRKFNEGTERLAAAMRASGLDVASRTVEGGGHGWKRTWAPDTQRWWIAQLSRWWSVPPALAR